jgi:FAD/FMN-containing dehydrogenase
VTSTSPPGSPAVTAVPRAAPLLSWDLADREAASRDFSWLSPVLRDALPATVPDAVARPVSVAEIQRLVAAAHRARVPLTPRGRGTGNYGQAVPLQHGVVLDTSGLDTVVDVGEGWVRAGAGATFTALEAAARASDQELAVFPSTVHSTVGGFVAGGAGGIGSLAHGFVWDGWVLGIEALPCDADPEPQRFEGPAVAPYLHTYGTTGVLTEVTLRLVPAGRWTTLVAGCPSWASATALALALAELDPTPRAVSVDEPTVVPFLAGRVRVASGDHAVRAIIDVSCDTTARAVVADHGGRVRAVAPDLVDVTVTSSFNHVTLRAVRQRPELCHLQVGGRALVERRDEVVEVAPDAMLHLDLVAGEDGAPGAAGLLLSRFVDHDALLRAMAELRALGVHVVDPHTWLLGGPQLELIRAHAARNDPHGLLNPGKLPPA